MTSFQQVVTSLSFFQFMANFEQSRKPDFGRISVTLTFFLIAKNRTKKILTQLSHYCFEKRLYFCQKIEIFCQKNADFSKIKRTLVLKGIFSKTTYVCVLMY